MQKNGPIALLFNALVITFMLAPLVIVCLVAFTPAETLQIPTTSFSLRWFDQVLHHPDFVQSFWNSLGLAVAANLIQASGGGIVLDSAPGQGTTVRITLPLAARKPTG